MNKRRILAFFLSISMVMSSNSIVLAADTQSMVSTEQMQLETTEETEEPEGEISEEDIREEKTTEEVSDEENSNDQSESTSDARKSGESTSGTESDEEDSSSEMSDQEESESEEQSSATEINSESEEQSSATEVKSESQEMTEEVSASEEEPVMTVEEMTEELNLESESEEIHEFTSADLVAELRDDGKYYLKNNNQNYKPTGEIVIPAEVQIIPSSTMLFKNNKRGIEKLTFASGSQLTTIEDDAFSDCKFSSDMSITLPSGLTSIGESAFQNAEMTKVLFNGSETNIDIGDYAFYGCPKLTTVSSKGRFKTIGESAFEADTKLEGGKELLSNVTSLGKKAFADCSALKVVKLDNLTAIPDEAFLNCTQLGRDGEFVGTSAVQIGDEVKTIGISAFEGCTGLTEVEIPGSVENIGAKAFYDCSNLTSVSFLSTSGTDGTCSTLMKYTSFPNKSGLVISAYDGTALDWVEELKNSGVTFNSSFTKYSIKSKTVGSGKLEFYDGDTVVASAKEGTLITIKPIPANGYIIHIRQKAEAVKQKGLLIRLHLRFQLRQMVLSQLMQNL